MSSQLQSSLVRGLMIAGSVILTGLLSLLPQLTGSQPLDWNALIRGFIVAVITALGVRFGVEGVYDNNRAKAVRAGQLNQVHKSDIGPQLVIPGKQ